MSEILWSQLLEGSLIAFGVIGAAWIVRSRHPVSRVLLILLGVACLLLTAWGIGEWQVLLTRMTKIETLQHHILDHLDSMRLDEAQFTHLDGRMMKLKDLLDNLMSRRCP